MGSASPYVWLWRPGPVTWRFSDGTTVELGGKVEGPSLFAQSLRAQLTDGEAHATVWPMPSPFHAVDVNDAALVNAWLEQETERWGRIANVVIRMRSKPENIPALPPPPWTDQDVPADAVY